MTLFLFENNVKIKALRSFRRSKTTRKWETAVFHFLESFINRLIL